MIGIENDNPYLHAAAEIGFATYVCETPNGTTRRDLPLAQIIAPRPKR